MTKLATSILILIIMATLIEGQDSYKLRKCPAMSKKKSAMAAVAYGSDSMVYMTETINTGASSPTTSRGRAPFEVVVKDKGKGTPRAFTPFLNTRGHDGPVSFTADFNTMVFSQQRPGPSRQPDVLGLYFAKRIDGKWIVTGAYPHNNPEAWLTAPSISADGKTLYFAANLAGGYGGYDLYKSRLIDGSWTSPENLGPEVNSEQNEFFPFIHSSGRLFFSSDGHDDSTDGNDIFESSFVDGQWLKARKLSTPINSKASERHVYFSKDFKSGYLTSDRDGGSMDIFIIEVEY